METKSKNPAPLRFKPLTEGLGLNHFADGLPYTPSTPTKKPLVQFQYPADRLRAQQATGVTEEAEPEVVEEPVPASAARRIAAYAVDFAITILLFVSIALSSFAINGLDLLALIFDQSPWMDRAQIFVPLALFYWVLHLGYFLILETTWQTTLGKIALGIRIRTTSGLATLGRGLCFFMSIVPFGVGLLWFFFDSKKRCWHDVITETEIVRA
jgi:uncharacterized RDD family membrane protein YckC